MVSRLICSELISRPCSVQKDEARFLAKFPAAAVGIKALLTAINEVREARGTIERRDSKNGTPAARRIEE